MITSAKGRRMLGNISPIYGQSRIMQAIMQAAGAEFDGASQLADEVFAQLFPQTATWGISYWETLLKIPSNKGLSIEQRRARVLSRMQYRRPMTRERLERIVNQFVVGKTARVVEIRNKYSFRAHILFGEIIYFYDLYKAVHEAKPAHLQFSPMALWHDVLAYIILLFRPYVMLHPELGSLRVCGYWPHWNSPGTVVRKAAEFYQLPVTGIYIFPHIGASRGAFSEAAMSLLYKCSTGAWVYPVSGIISGTMPESSALGAGATKKVKVESRARSHTGINNYLRCGNFNAGMSVNGQEVA